MRHPHPNHREGQAFPEYGRHLEPTDFRYLQPDLPHPSVGGIPFPHPSEGVGYHPAYHHGSYGGYESQRARNQQSQAASMRPYGGSPGVPAAEPESSRQRWSTHPEANPQHSHRSERYASEWNRLNQQPIERGPHAGKGPRGYRRLNERIVEDVCDNLERHGAVDATEVEVACNEGIVTLKGKVSDRQAKRAAEDCASYVPGVRDVMNHLEVDQGFFSRLFGSKDSESNQPS